MTAKLPPEVEGAIRDAIEDISARARWSMYGIHADKTHDVIRAACEKAYAAGQASNRRVNHIARRVNIVRDDEAQQ